MPHSVVSHCAHPTVPVDIWARCNSVSWDNSTLGLVVWIGIDSWLLWINLQVNSQATKLSNFCVETYRLHELANPYLDEWCENCMAVTIMVCLKGLPRILWIVATYTIWYALQVVEILDRLGKAQT